jgi:tRNA pseudouridine13 synthase
MFVSAYQSFLFNCALSTRFDDGHTLSDPIPGDRLIFTNGRTDSATAANLAAAALHIRRGRCSIALFMPGKGQSGIQTQADPVTEALLLEANITPEDFSRAAAFVRTKFEGAFRPIALKTDAAYTINGADLQLNFSLPPGHYATTVCREYMKSDPVMMV